MTADSSWASTRMKRPVRNDGSILVPEVEVLPWGMATCKIGGFKFGVREWESDNNMVPWSVHLPLPLLLYPQ